jgi:hypothetical protein
MFKKMHGFMQRANELTGRQIHAQVEDQTRLVGCGETLSVSRHAAHVQLSDINILLYLPRKIFV